MEDRQDRNRPAQILLAGMIAGLLVAAAGLAWMAVDTPSAAWSPEKAAHFKAASDAVHAARSAGAGHNGSQAASPDVDEAQRAPEGLAAAQARFDRLNAELAEARTRPQRRGMWLVRWGLAAMVLFGIGYLSTRDR